MTDRQYRGNKNLLDFSKAAARNASAASPYFEVLLGTITIHVRQQ
jgi:hypothetical protein